MVQSKLFSEPGFYGNQKSASRLWGLAQYYSAEDTDLDISIDNESGVSSQIVAVPLVVVIWHTATGAVMNWTTASGAPMVWSISGAGVSVFPPTAVGQNGVLIGMTVTTNAADVALLSLAIGTELEGYRG